MIDERGDLPAPLTPPECDLRGYDFMPFFGHRLFGSEFYARATDAEFRVAMRLWWAAWQQCPAGSIPSDDATLARFADFGRDVAGWLEVKERALHGFVLCSDGRYYHAMLAEEALKAYDRRLRADAKRIKDRERLDKWREAKQAEREGRKAPHEKASEPDPELATAKPETHSPPESETHDETRFTTQSETRFVAVDRTGQDRTGQDKEKEEFATLTPRETRDREFAEWWAAYPRKVAKEHARKAYDRAVKRGASPGALLLAVRAYPFSPDPQYIPHPTSWLNGGRWQDDPNAAVTAPSNPRDSPPPKPGSQAERDALRAHFDRILAGDDPAAEPSERRLLVQ